MQWEDDGNPLLLLLNQSPVTEPWCHTDDQSQVRPDKDAVVLRPTGRQNVYC